MKKTAALIVVAASMLISAYSVSAEISVSIDGRDLEFSKAPRMINDRVMVPVRKILEELGAIIAYDGETKTATAVKDARYAQFTEGSDYVLFGVCRGGENDGELSYATSEKIDSKPVILDDTMYVPLRAVSESFYYDVEWNGEEQKVVITTPTDADGWIYYSCWNDKGHMYKTDTNGQNRQMIADGDCYMESMSFMRSAFEYDNGYIYYALRNPENPEKDGCLYRIKTDGTGKKQITDAPAVIMEINSEAGKDEIYVLESVDGEREKFGGLINKKLYLKKIDMASKEETLILEDPIQRVRIYNQEYIYFMYNGEEKEDYACYRMDINGENIIKISGDIPIRYYLIDEVDEKIRFENAVNYTSYIANLDGSDLKKEERNSIYDEIDSEYIQKYNLESYYKIADSKDVEKIYNVGKTADGDLYIFDSEGEEISKISSAEGIIDVYNIEIYDDKIFYRVRKGEYKRNIFYVDTIDELLGKNYISVGSEKVDDKYEITDNNGMRYIPSEEDGIYRMNFDGSDNRRVIAGNGYLGTITTDGKLIWSDNDSDKVYRMDLDGSNQEEYSPSEYYSDYIKSERTSIGLKENAMFGIVVKNDGTVERYENLVR